MTGTSTLNACERKVDGMMLSSILLAAALTITPVHGEQVRAYSVEAKDTVGFEASLYRGKWFTPKARHARACIMHRESRNDYTARNTTSSAAGAYQFLDSKWRDSLVWMMLEESNETNDGLTDEIKALRKMNIAKWSRYFQDRAFYTVWQYGKGKDHWYHGGIKC